MEVITKKPLPIHCDGEVLGNVNQVTFTLSEKKLKTIKR